LPLLKFQPSYIVIRGPSGSNILFHIILSTAELSEKRYWT